MKARRTLMALFAAFVFLAVASPAAAQRAFVSARTGSDGNPCTLLSPCRSFGTAIAAVGAGGEVVALDSGGYGPVTITKSITIESPSGIYAGVTTTSGDAVTVAAGSTDVVTLRGLVLNAGPSNGVVVNSVGTLNVENCFITGFSNGGIHMNSAAWLIVNGTNISACFVGIDLANTSGALAVSVDHCHLDGNGIGYRASTTPPGSSSTTATYSTANFNNSFGYGWVCGFAGSGIDVLNLEFCTGSENTAGVGLFSSSTNAGTHVRYSNCVFSNNDKGINHAGAGTVESRGNSTITGNVSGNIVGFPVIPFSPL